MEALKRLEELNISVNNVQVDSEFPTGTVNITFDENYEPIFNVIPDVAFDHIEFSPEALKLARNADCLFFGLLPQRFGISKNTIRELIKESPGSIKFFDLKLFQHFFNSAVVEHLLQCSHIVRIKEKEINFLAGKLDIKYEGLAHFCQQLVNKYKIDVVLITRGPNGVFAFHKDQGDFYDPGYLVIMKDNIGSGMAFCAGFIHYHLQRKKIQDALSFGNAAGALNATKVGATSFFTKNEVLTFMKKTRKKNLESA
jgi:fructokinase